MAATALDSVIGHATAVAGLRRQLDGGELPHALLISGPERVGKTTLALALAADVLNASNWPGGITAHPDCWIEDGDSERIGIARVRSGRTAELPSLQDFLALRSYLGGARMAVIGRAERLTEEAANCLLKTIEEPPPGCHIVLCTAHPEGLPATILSRCQSLGLAPVGAGVMAPWLVGAHAVDGSLATLAAALAMGRPGRALRLATEPGALAAELDALDGFIAAAGGGVSGALEAAATLAPAAGAEGRERAILQLNTWTTFLRDCVCVAENAGELITWSAYRETCQTWADAVSGERLVAMLGMTMNAIQDVARNAQPRLCYDVLLVDLFGGVGGIAAPPKTAPTLRDSSLAAAPAGQLKSRATTARKPAARRPARR